MQSRVIDIGGPVHYLDFGGEGTPIICIHGATACAATWAGVATMLSGSHRVVAPDLIGHGRTPLHGRVPRIAADQHLIDRLMDELGMDSAILLSITRGCLVALRQAQARSDRVVGLVLNEPPVASLRHPPPPNLLALIALTTWPWLAQRVAGHLFEIQAGSEPMVRHWLDMTCAHPNLVATDQVALLEETARDQLDHPEPLLGWALAFKEIGRLVVSGSIGSLYRNVDRPAMIVFGRDSTTSSMDAVVQLASGHPSWPLELLDGIGHPPLEAPRALADRINAWLDRLDGPPA